MIDTPTEEHGEYGDKEQLCAILDNLIEFVVRWQPDGIRTYVNPAYCRYYNVSREEAIGTSFFPHIAEEDLEKVKQRIARLSIDSPTSSDTHRVISPVGEICWQEWTDTAIYDDQGNLVEYQSTGRDISARKKSEEQLAAYREELESLVEERTRELRIANEELKAFSYSVSHDLRAPLRRIDGFSSLLEEEYLDHLDGTAKNYLCRIRTGIRHMAGLIDDLLMFSQAASRKIQKRKVDLSSLANEIASELREAQPDRRVEFSLENDVTGDGDEHLLRVVLDNLLGNAWKYSGKAACAQIDFGMNRTQSAHTYFVRDNGVGFDMKNSEQVFLPFQRLHQTSEFEGTGVGLATVSRIIQRHGGRIWVEAATDNGATFYFTLGG